MNRRTFLLAALAAGPASAHSWYHGSCCSDQDCVPVAEGSVVAKPDGWHVTLPAGSHPILKADFHEVVPYGDSRILPSKDENFHVCIHPYHFKVRCLYVTGGSA